MNGLQSLVYQTVATASSSCSTIELNFFPESTFSHSTQFSLSSTLHTDKIPGCVYLETKRCYYRFVKASYKAGQKPFVVSKGELVETLVCVREAFL